MVTVDINYWAVLVSALAAFGIGAVWYSLLFGKKWMELMNINSNMANKPDMKRKATKGYIITFIALLLMAYILSHFVDYTEANSIVEGMTAGFWIWLGFLATTMIGSFLWEEKPFTLYLINVGHYLVVLLVMGAIVAVWA
jgi:Protein of unknown function (DUF1761)